jgi:hypothetical protein
VKVLLDECLDRNLGPHLAGCTVKTAPAMGWAGIKTGALLSLAQAEFDVFLTMDRNLAFQQNLPRYDIAVVVMRAKSNRLADLLPLIPKVLAAVPSAPRGAATIVQ